MFDIDLFFRAITSLIVITAPFDPIKVLFFNNAIEASDQGRKLVATKVSLNVAAVLGASALVGRQFLDIIGINMHAFSVVGGVIIALMGFEMLYGGEMSKAQGEKQGPSTQDTLFVPLTLPLIAGPGAITTTITIASQGEKLTSIIVALSSAAVVAVVTFLSFTLFGNAISKIRPTTMKVVLRIGGMLLATIGVQMMLGGLKHFFSG